MLLRELLIAVVVVVLFFALSISLVGSGVSSSILAGALTGLIEGVIMFPLENIKIQQQLDGQPMKTIIKKTWRMFGLGGFFMGLTPVLIGAVPTQAIRWGSFEIYCSYFDCSGLVQIALGGIFAGILNSLVTGVPIETMKTSIIHGHFGGGGAVTNNSTSGSSSATVGNGVTFTTGVVNNKDSHHQHISNNNAHTGVPMDASMSCVDVGHTLGSSSSTAETLQSDHTPTLSGSTANINLLGTAIGGGGITTTTQAGNDAPSAFFKSPYKPFDDPRLLRSDSARPPQIQHPMAVATHHHQPHFPSLQDMESPLVLPVDPSKLVQSRRMNNQQQPSAVVVMPSLSRQGSLPSVNRMLMPTGSPASAMPPMGVRPRSTHQGGAGTQWDESFSEIPTTKSGKASAATPPAYGNLRGWLPTVLKKLLNQAIRFPAHAFFLRMLCVLATGVAAEQAKTHCRSGFPLINFIAGAGAGLASIVITQPIDVAKTRMQGLSGDRYRHTIHCLRSIFASEGIKGFAHGITSRSIRVALGSGLTFAIFPIFQAVFVGLAHDFSQFHGAGVPADLPVALRPGVDHHHLLHTAINLPTTAARAHLFNQRPHVLQHL